MIQVLILISCHSEETVFDRVVNYYKEDSLKRQAAIFIANYSKIHYGIPKHLAAKENKNTK